MDLNSKESFQKNNPKIINAWASYDWANSVYALTISSAIFPVYYNAVTRDAFDGNKLSFLGYSFENTALYSYAIAISFLIAALLSPLLSGIADFGGMKKSMMKFFVYLGSLGCGSLYFFDGQNIEFGIFGFVAATVGWAGSLVFYNSYLPEIATEDRFDSVSAKGFALGYIGSVLLLVLNLLLILFPELVFPIQEKVAEIQQLQPSLSAREALQQANSFFESEASRISFLTVGIWWAGFSQIAFSVLPNSSKNKKHKLSDLIAKGFKELQMVWKSLENLPNLKWFLASFFFYSMGVQTIMLLAATFGEQEIGLDDASLIATVLILQLVAIGGAYIFAIISEKYGNKVSLQIMIFIWIGICFGAYLTVNTNQFYVLAVAVGIIMGGIQSLSRATYSKLIPKDTIDTTSYFSFYDVAEKFSVAIGTFTFGLINQLYESMRNSTLALAIFFVIGLLLLSKFKMDKK